MCVVAARSVYKHQPLRASVLQGKLRQAGAWRQHERRPVAFKMVSENTVTIATTLKQLAGHTTSCVQPVWNTY